MPKFAVVVALALATLAASTVRASDAPDLPRSLQIAKETHEVRGKLARQPAPVEEPHVASSGARDPGGH